MHKKLQQVTEYERLYFKLSYRYKHNERTCNPFAAATWALSQ